MPGLNGMNDRTVPLYLPSGISGGRYIGRRSVRLYLEKGGFEHVIVEVTVGHQAVAALAPVNPPGILEDKHDILKPARG